MSELSSELHRLVERLRGGSPGARADLLAHSRARLHLLVGQMLRGYPRLLDVLETSDVLHNVLIRLDRALQAAPPATPLDYVRLCCCHIRRELVDLVRHHFPPGRPGPGPEASDLPTASDAPERLAMWAEFHEAIAALDDDDRQLFDLLYYQGLTQPEAAELLGRPLKTLKTHWRNARLRLMARLGDGPFP